MASNNKELRYIDTTPAPRVSKKTLNKMVWLSTMLQASFNYERMQSGGWLWAMLPGLEEVHTNKEDLSTSMIQNLDFINTDRALDGADENGCTDDSFSSYFCGCATWRNWRRFVLVYASSNYRGFDGQYGNQWFNTRSDPLFHYFVWMRDGASLWVDVLVV